MFEKYGTFSNEKSCAVLQYGKRNIFISLRFYVKSILGNTTANCNNNTQNIALNFVGLSNFKGKIKAYLNSFKLISRKI